MFTLMWNKNIKIRSSFEKTMFVAYANFWIVSNYATNTWRWPATLETKIRQPIAFTINMFHRLQSTRNCQRRHDLIHRTVTCNRFHGVVALNIACQYFLDTFFPSTKHLHLLTTVWATLRLNIDLVHGNCALHWVFWEQCLQCLTFNNTWHARRSPHTVVCLEQFVGWEAFHLCKLLRMI